MFWNNNFIIGQLICFRFNNNHSDEPSVLPSRFAQSIIRKCQWVFHENLLLNLHFFSDGWLISTSIQFLSIRERSVRRLMRALNWVRGRINFRWVQTIITFSSTFPFQAGITKEGSFASTYCTLRCAFTLVMGLKHCFFLNHLSPRWFARVCWTSPSDAMDCRIRPSVQNDYQGFFRHSFITTGNCRWTARTWVFPSLSISIQRWDEWRW